jgi:DNA-binding CsgD family transcriptional regulator
MKTPSHRSLSVVSRIGAAATSITPVEDRTEEILDQLQRVFPYDAAMVVSLRAPGGERRAVASRGYPAAFAQYLTTPQWHQEIVEPYGVPSGGWPIRESDLPVDPESIPALATYGRDAGLFEGLLSALMTPGGAFAGFLILSWTKAETPPDEAVEVIGSITPTLANILDPLSSSRALAAALDDGAVALAFQPDGSVVTLRGLPPEELVAGAAHARQAITQWCGRGATTVNFMWPRAGGGWYGCRAHRCQDGIDVLLVRELESPYGLTRRELEVLTCLVAGASNAEIAAKLWVTTRTARAHVEHILEKLSVTSRSAAVGRAISEGLLLPALP